MREKLIGQASVAPATPCCGVERRAVGRGTHSEGGTLVMALHPNDVLQRQLPNGKQEYVLVRRFSSSGQVFFKPLTMAREPNPEVSRKPDPLLKEGWRKVSINPIGRVTPAR